VTVIEFDVALADGRTLHAYDTGGGPGSAPDDRLPVLWQHGTPNIGAPPAPLFPTADRLGLRWVGHDRPGYGGSTTQPDRHIASVARDVAAVTDALDLDRFAVVGHSGAGPHALACGALLADRVAAVVSISGPAPYPAEGLDWFDGMGSAGVASLGAALEGRAAKERSEATAEAMPDFTAADEAALAGEWSWFLEVVRPALVNGPAPLVDDDLATVSAWGFEPALVGVPAWFLHGADDRVIPSSHGGWLAGQVPAAELRITQGEGHLSVLTHAEAALEWLREVTG